VDELVDQQLIYEYIGREIAQHRALGGLSQADLARSVKLTRSSISNIEKGRQKMLVHTLLDIAASLHVVPSLLLPTVAAHDDQDLFSGTALTRPERDHISAIVSRIKALQQERP
jgi:transcriptional regulator with XRE-family HTH domain